MTTSAPALDKAGDIATLLTGLDGPTVVFIDEIHRLKEQIEELCYAAMEDQRMDVRLGEGPDARVLTVPLPPFTLIGATTQQGLLSGPLRDQLGFVARLQPYPVDALSAIVARSAGLLGVAVTDAAAAAIAERSRGTPRVANMWLRRVRDWAQLAGHDPVDATTVDEALAAFSVDDIGLDEAGQQILTALVDAFAGGPVGLTTLAAAVGEAPGTVSEVYEPFLLRRGLIARTPRGRTATAGAWAHLGRTPPATATPGRAHPAPTGPMRPAGAAEQQSLLGDEDADSESAGERG